MFTIWNLFQQTCLNHGNRTGVKYYNGNLKSYLFSEIKNECDQIFSHLKGCLDLGGMQKSYVGILLDIDATFPSVVLGILQLGLPFVCFDGGGPLRIKNLIRKLKISIVITESKYHSELKVATDQSTCLKKCNIFDRELEIWSTGVYRIDVLPKANIIYAIQTSGSTGDPKIVQVPESCILPNILELRDLFNISPNDVIYFSSPVTFDPSMVELFIVLTTGASLFIVQHHIKADVAKVLEVMFQKNEDSGSCGGVTFIQTTPSLFLRWPADFVKEKVMDNDSSLRILLLGGEKCPSWNTISKFRSENNTTTIYSVYGITEVSCWASWRKVTPEDDGSDLGVAMRKTELQVRGSNGDVINDGLGEMFIGGERFCIVDDENPSELKFPLFRPSGDVVQVHKNKFKFIGRIDRVIKRWGQRVSLSRLESVSMDLDGIRGCCSLFDETHGLVLFIMVNQSSKSWTKHFWSFIKKKLPPASIPDLVVPVDKLPVNKHGKLDMKYFKELLKSEYVPTLSKLDYQNTPKDKIVLQFKELWIRHTNTLEKVEVDNISENLADLTEVDELIGFISSGGNSISAIQLISELSNLMKVPQSLIGDLLNNIPFTTCLQKFLSHFDKCSGVAGDMKESVNEAEIDDFNSETVRLSESSRSKTSIAESSSFDKNESIVSPKRLKLDKLDKVSAVMYRGRIEYLLSGIKPDYPHFNKLCIKSKFDLKKCVDASPTLVEYRSGRILVLVGSHSGNLLIWNVKDDSIIKLRLPDRIESCVAVSVCGRYAFVGCYDKNVYCFNINTKDILWKFPTSDVVKSKPVINGSSVIVGSYDHQLYSICCKTGKELWKYKSNASFSSTPILCNGSVIAASLDGMCLALSSNDGTLLWTNKLQSPVFSSPVIFNSIFVCAEVEGTIHFIDVTNGETRQTFHVDGNIFSSLCVHENADETRLLFGCHNSYTYCLSVTHDPIIIWKVKLNSPVFSTPFVAEYKTGNLVVVCSTKGTTYVLESNNGRVVASLTLPGEVFSSPVANSHNIFVGCRDNYVYKLYLEHES